MAIKIEVVSRDVDVRSGRNERGDWTIREQHAYMHKGSDPYPERIKITLEKDQTAYEPGNYELADSSFFVGKYNDLMCRPRLVPMPAGQGAASKAS